MIKPTILNGRWLLPDDANAVVINTDLLRDETDIKVGDEITLKINSKEKRIASSASRAEFWRAPTLTSTTHTTRRKWRARAGVWAFCRFDSKAQMQTSTPN